MKRVGQNLYYIMEQRTVNRSQLYCGDLAREWKGSCGRLCAERRAQSAGLKLQLMFTEPHKSPPFIFSMEMIKVKAVR